MTEAHARLEAATAAVTESKRLRSKVNRVLEVLLKGKYLSQIVEALHKLGESGGVEACSGLIHVLKSDTMSRNTVVLLYEGYFELRTPLQ